MTYVHHVRARFSQRLEESSGSPGDQKLLSFLYCEDLRLCPPSGLCRSLLLKSEWMLWFVSLLLDAGLGALLGFSHFSLWCFKGARAGTGATEWLLGELSGVE